MSRLPNIKARKQPSAPKTKQRRGATPSLSLAAPLKRPAKVSALHSEQKLQTNAAAANSSLWAPLSVPAANTYPQMLSLAGKRPVPGSHPSHPAQAQQQRQQPRREELSATHSKSQASR